MTGPISEDDVRESTGSAARELSGSDAQDLVDALRDQLEG